MGSVFLKNVRLAPDARLDADMLYDVKCCRGRIDSIAPAKGPDTGNGSREGSCPFGSPSSIEEGSEIIIEAGGSILLPGLVHPHVHLDKAYLLDECQIVDGTFKEAMEQTSKAKAGFTFESVYTRGRSLLDRSISHGVTSMRAHVEVDPTVNLVCLEAALKLKEEHRDKIDLFIVVFAQDPIFPDLVQDPSQKALQTAKEMRELLTRAARMEGVDAIGSAPYVEPGSRKVQLDNARWIIKVSEENELDIDFHLDYSLDPDLTGNKEPLLLDVLKLFKESLQSAGTTRRRRLTLGHCTRISVFPTQVHDQLVESATEGEMDSSISLVALPNSDMYMQGRDVPYATRSRATFPALDLAKRGVRCSMGVNNVGNLFTPQGDADPLALLPMMVGVWQGATEEDIALLLAMVSTEAAFSAGLPLDRMSSLCLCEGQHADLVLVDGAKSVRDVVFSPPYGRTTIKNGKVVARRTVVGWSSA